LGFTPGGGRKSEMERFRKFLGMAKSMEKRVFTRSWTVPFFILFFFTSPARVFSSEVAVFLSGDSVFQSDGGGLPGRGFKI